MTQQWLTTDIFGFYLHGQLFNELLSSIRVIIPSHYTTFRSLHSLHMSHEPYHPLLTWKLLNIFYGWVCMHLMLISEPIIVSCKQNVMYGLLRA